MKSKIVSLTVGLFWVANVMCGQENMKTENFTFEFEDNKLSGFIDLPEGRAPSGIVVFVHGHGQSNVANTAYYDSLRSNFLQIGLACCLWDKAGCGQSEGEYNHDQTVQNSAEEVLAAIEELKHLNIPGSDRIGLWGISRAGWICPLVIEEYPSIAFWISVSGTDGLDSYRYLLESNLRIDGRSESELNLLMAEWDYANKCYQRGGVSFDEFMKATKNLFQDPFFKSLGGGLTTEEEFLQTQNYYQNSGFIFDEESGLVVLVTNFPETLKKIHCPVLAIFGEKDSQVDWRKTIALYKKTIGVNPKAELTIKTFPNCNHITAKCKTGGIRENMDSWQPCDGYYATMLTWLKEHGFGK